MHTLVVVVRWMIGVPGIDAPLPLQMPPPRLTAPRWWPFPRQRRFTSDLASGSILSVMEFRLLIRTASAAESSAPRAPSISSSSATITYVEVI